MFTLEGIHFAGVVYVDFYTCNIIIKAGYIFATIINAVYLDKSRLKM